MYEVVLTLIMYTDISEDPFNRSIRVSIIASISKCVEDAVGQVQCCGGC